MSYKKFRQQRIITTHKSVWDVRQYLKGAYRKWADLYEVLEWLSSSDQKHAEELSIYDTEIAKMFQMSLDAA